LLCMKTQLFNQGGNYLLTVPLRKDEGWRRQKKECVKE
jgi:hypothetical protein